MSIILYSDESQSEPYLKYIINNIEWYINPNPKIWKDNGYTLEEVLEINKNATWAYLTVIRSIYNKKDNIEDYICYIDKDKMIETLLLLNYKPIYLVDLNGKVVWYLSSRYET